jgi:hypothetical protein
MPELETALYELGAEIDYPSTPDFARLVGGRLRGARLRVTTFEWRRYALAAALVLAAAGAAVLAWQPARDTVAAWLGVPGVGVHRVQKLPPIPTPSPGAFGTQTTLTQAGAQAGFPVREPPGLGTATVYVNTVPPGIEVALVYQTPGGQVVLTELRGTLSQYSFEKLVGPDSTIQPVSVNGRNGWWLSGHPHAFFYDDAQGNAHTDTLRLATNTLAWEQDGVIYRIEGASLTRESALGIAAGLH